MDGMLALMGKFAQLRKSQRTVRLSRMQHLLKAVSDLAVSTVRFNTLSVCRVRHDEVKHSAILAWFLDASSGHGQGALFLQAFMDCCGIQVAAPTSYRVKTEFSGPEAIIDVMVSRRREFLLYIENKVFASERPDQVDREFRDMRLLGRSLCIPEEQQFAVFLTPSGKLPKSGDAARWLSVSYFDLAATFTRAASQITAPKVRDFVDDWAEAVQAWRYDNAVL